MGGYDGTGHLTDLKWTYMSNDEHYYRLNLKGISLNNHELAGTELFSNGFIDTGTTFTYVPQRMFDAIRQGFESWFCPDQPNNCGSKLPNK